MENKEGKIRLEFGKFGLFEDKTKNSIPLESLDLKVQASYSYAKIIQTLKFKNVNPNNTNATFFLPKSMKSTMSKLDIYYGDLVAHGNVLHRITAKA